MRVLPRTLQDIKIKYYKHYNYDQNHKKNGT